jgi:hypothetical protein
MSRSAMSGVHSCGLLNSSPMAMAWRSAGASGGSRRVLGREWVFEKEQSERLDILCELDSLRRPHALVHVVQQLHFLAQLLAARFDHLEGASQVNRRLVHG